MKFNAKRVMFVVMLVCMLEVLVGCSAMYMADQLAANEAAGHQAVIVSQVNTGK